MYVAVVVVTALFVAFTAADAVPGSFVPELDCRLACFADPDFETDEDRFLLEPPVEGRATPAALIAFRIAGVRACPDAPCDENAAWGGTNDPGAKGVTPGIAVPLSAGAGRIATFGV